MDEHEELKELVKKLQAENEDLRKTNEGLVKERDKYKAFNETNEKILNELGPGTIQLLDALKKLLNRAHNKIECFEQSSPLVFLEFDE